MINYTPYDSRFWDKKIAFNCVGCGYVMTPSDHLMTKRKYSVEHETEMDFFTCPSCGNEAIVLW